MPAISVILPVYNAEAFLKAAVDSILQQTFTDFELIIINDGSTDSSTNIISSYTDPRIVAISNAVNKGLIYCLNKGIELARSPYIARMDADDISLPERFAVQKKYLDEHGEIDLVASFSNMINEQGEAAGFFAPDRQFVKPLEIKARMPRENCLAHPTVMGRTSIFKTFAYAAYQQHIEDYDLWLRLLSSGKIIAKIPQPLLLYRVHSASVTHVQLKRDNFFWKHFLCKKRFLFREIKAGNLNLFNAKVAVEMVADFVKAILKWVKGLVLRR